MSTGLIDLASRLFGGSVMATNDDFYGDVHQLLAPEAPRHDPAEFGPRGKTYDGWETRRRRTPGEDWVIIRLGVPGIVRSVYVDTAFFRGNYPPFASLDAVALPGYPAPAEVAAADWRRLVDKGELAGDEVNVFEVDGGEGLATHLRLTIHPDGGVARLRVLGAVVPDPRRLGGRVDLAALEHGGAIEACSNMFYAAPANVLGPGRPLIMADGWETARRRDDGNDWLVVRLGLPGVLHEAVIDTSRFVGNAPGEVLLTDADTGVELLPRTRVQPDTEHVFRLATHPAVRRVRLDVFPDGGIARLRLRGAVADEAREPAAARWLSILPPAFADAVDPAEFFS